MLGNGVETTYTYDSERRWLDTIKTKNDNGDYLQNITYNFDDIGNVDSYTNDSEDYYTSQTYQYDSLNQLTNAEGTHLSRPHGITSYKSQYNQSFGYDTLGRLTGKASQVLNTSGANQGKGLNYTLDYQYYQNKPHQPERIGNLYYKYDLNGNMTEEREGGHSEETTQQEMEVTEENGVYSVPYAFGLYRGYETENDGIYQRTYTWDEENRLKQTLEDDQKVQYTYDQSGQRTVKYSTQGETLYFDSLWSLTRDTSDFRQSKHIYLGETRIATKLGLEDHMETGYSGYEEVNTYYYSSDHLGSAQYITDYEGERYSHYEYTPHGELWIEKTKDEFDMIPFRFTAKELDEETGNYYIGARYFNPKTAVWLSADPAIMRYIPASPLSKNAAHKNSKLPGSGGLFNYVNFDLYTYAANNPVKYVDPTGSDFIILNDWDAVFLQGHQAILVGNDNDGWMYFSRDDYRQSDPENMTSNGIRRKLYRKLKDFFDDNKISKNYNRKLVMSSSPSEDKKMISKGNNIVKENLPYDLNYENCADLVNQILESIDIDSMEGAKEWAFTPMLPDVQYDNVKKNNEDIFVGEFVDGVWTFDYDKSMQSDYTYDKKGQFDANTN